MTLPTDGSANIDVLHPIFVRRVEALLADHPVLAAVYKTVSGGRPYAEQKYLYDGHKAGLPGFNVASNPDTNWGPVTYFGMTFDRKGSNHQVQDMPDGDHALALDANYSRMGAQARAIWDFYVPRKSEISRPGFDRARLKYGLCRPVESPKWEPWHAQPIGDIVTPYDSPVEELTMADVAAITAKLENIDNDLAAVRGKVDRVDDLVAVKIDAAVEKLDDRLEAVERGVIDQLNGGAGVVRRGDKRWLIVGNRRHDITALDRDAQVELKAHFGIERNSNEATDAAWAAIEALTESV